MHKDEKDVSVEHVVVDKLPAPAGMKTEARKLDSSLMILSCSILLAALLISATLLYVKSGTSTAVNQPAPTATSVAVAQRVQVGTGAGPLLGSPDAKVTFVEFSDFQCPYCTRFYKDTFGQIKKDYVDTGKVKVALRHFPLSFHPGAMPAALAALCANDQGKYWEMHDKIFGEQVTGGTAVQLNETSLKKWARDLGMNGATFDQCLDSKKYQKTVDQDITDGGTAGVQGTPAFFVNGRLISGAVPFAQFKAVLDEELAAAGNGGPGGFLKKLFK